MSFQNATLDHSDTVYDAAGDWVDAGNSRVTKFKAEVAMYLLTAGTAWDWHMLWDNLEKLGLAFVISLPLGFEREKEAHSSGIRTFPIVAMASCGYILVAMEIAGNQADTSRVLQGLITGIGFIGGGSILKDGLNVRGTATAASIWNVGAIGAAVAVGRNEIAVMLALLNLLALHFLIPLKKKLAGGGAADEVK